MTVQNAETDAELVTVELVTQLDANGSGRVVFKSERGDFQIMSVSVKATPSDRESIATVCGDGISDATYQGSTGDVSDTRYYLAENDSIVIQWEQGNPHATALAIITGNPA
jgi:hypothetical protein